MNLDEIKQILEMMREHELAEFELEREGVTLRLRKNTGSQWAGGAMPPMNFVPAPGAASHPAAAPPPPATPVLEPAEDVEFAIVKSPIVGTFYRAAEPGAKPFVEPGQIVKKGQVLCIIEAMKLMNEITAECDGELVKAYVENGQAVQYGERLFALKPA
ncbi:MAG TPA: acetyl-CoA carboxylase biotin carboxyl carrier protein [Vicinamibacterales bacterium]|jgi:acetyl-CoA carboxylase biotin carboxyl carrier protein|nr:acetyl-CoA carboxylase biotin carboxyl carrier protein [Vicinamibacterales bacterium]